MTGYLRFALASLVVANHVWLPTANRVGLHAVAGFFVISGYLMTMVINEVYPMFLLHFFALGFVRWIIPVSLSPLATVEFISTYATTFAMSCAVVRWFNPAIDRLRDSLRPRRRNELVFADNRHQHLSRVVAS